ncbi:MAG: thymidine phosphorylase, partial [Armatimonadota bacterium]
VAVPLAAAAGVPVAKMSGRGLGHSGGTLDKLESVPGLRVELTAEEFVRQVDEVGLAIVGQTGDLVPADKMMYALRDVTGTVPSPALIASSVMSKKVAGGASAIVLDVKCGSGAFMKTEADAKRLARLMLTVGAAFGRSTRAIISDMDEPLGTAIGNACEVREAIETLRGGGPADLRALAIEIAAIMVHAADGAASLADARARVEDALTSGLGLERLAAMIEFQCGDASVVDAPNRLPRARVEAAVESERAGIVQRVDALQVGRAAMLAGAGRENKDQKVDPGAGVVLSAVRGDSVSSGDAVAVVFGSDEARARAGAEALRSAYRIGDAAPPARQFVFKEVAGDSA